MPSTIMLPEILEITDSDIEQMQDAFESPMCDIGSQNAAALALSKALGGIPVRICPHESATSHPVAEVGEAGDTRIPLPATLDRWLRQALHGLNVQPRCFRLGLDLDESAATKMTT